MSLLVDISTADLFVRDYVSTAFSTYRPNDTSVSVDYGPMVASGFLSEDLLRISDLEIGYQIFQEAERVIFRDESFDDQNSIRSVLGLAPDSLGSDYGSSSPFERAVSNGLLHHNVFGLRLAPPAELTIGDLNCNLFQGNIIHVPLLSSSNGNGPPVTGRWQTCASHITVKAPRSIKASLAGYSASFTTSLPFIYLPSQIAKELTTLLGLTE